MVWCFLTPNRPQTNVQSVQVSATTSRLSCSEMFLILFTLFWVHLDLLNYSWRVLANRSQYVRPSKPFSISSSSSFPFPQCFSRSNIKRPACRISLIAQWCLARVHRLQFAKLQSVSQPSFCQVWTSSRPLPGKKLLRSIGASLGCHGFALTKRSTTNSNRIRSR